MATQATSATTTGSGPSAPHELFVLSDEQILEIEPETQPPSHDSRMPGGENPEASRNLAPPATGHESQITNHDSRATSHEASQRGAQPEIAVPPEPPLWLVAQMKDPWGGEEAREFWNGVQQARTEAAAYRAAIASPEDARALKELYPGGVAEARAAADRARLLDEVDRAYFGGAGNSPEQTSASRAQLAQRMLQEDPAAFREMVETGMRILQAAAPPGSRGGKTLGSAVSDATGHVVDAVTPTSSVVAQHAAPQLGNASANNAHVAAYAAFERAANEDLERSVGSAIERTLAQALPVAQPLLAVRGVNEPQGPGAQARVPALRERLSAAIRQDIEQALQGDRQLGEQVAQILASRRFDNDARAQVVRLIAERAQQLVPGAAKRVLNEWTQTTLAAHRTRTQRDDAAATRREVAPASVPARQSDAATGPRRQDASANNARHVDYRKFSDEQILNMS